MTLQMEKPPADRPPPRPGPPAGYNTAFLAAGAVLLAVLVALAAYLIFRDDDGGIQADDTTTTVTTAPSTTATAGATTATSATSASTATTATTATTASTATTATTATTAPSQSQSGVVWPDPDSGSGFDTPEQAAQGFALDLAGFAQPVIGEFRSGDSRSGEIEVRPSADGPVTTVLVRQVGSDDSWWVIGAVSGDIVLDQPSTGDTVGDSLRLVGRARAFEGTVDVDLYLHGSGAPIVNGFVTGRGDGELGEFDESFDVPATASGPAMLVLTSASAEDGSAWTVSAIPLTLS